MARKKGLTSAQIGVGAFILGVILAIILGLVPGLVDTASTVLVLGILGIIVGVLNVGDKEASLFLIATIALLVAAGTATSAFQVFLDYIPAAGVYLIGILTNVITFIAPGAAIVALKVLYDVSRK